MNNIVYAQILFFSNITYCITFIYCKNGKGDGKLLRANCFRLRPLVPSRLALLGLEVERVAHVTLRKRIADELACGSGAFVCEERDDA